MDFQSFLELAATIKLSNVASYDHFRSSGGDLWAGTSVVLVGCGSWQHFTEQADAPLLLQNKGARQHFGKDFTSVTKMLTDPLDGYLEKWKAWPAEPVSLNEFVGNLRLVAEDGNPDSIFSFLLLLARAARVPISEIPLDWIEAVDEWERTGTADAPFQSWCSLESALAHSLMSAEGFDGPSTYTAAWQAGLSFAISSLKQGDRVLSLPTSPESPHHAKAYAALVQDQRIYEDWLQHASIIQLSLPVADLPNRRLLVDTLMVEEGQLTGASKNFYRNDLVNSPLKSGFTLSVVYRPAYTEARPDITISVDPRRRVSLAELWEKLEEAETEAWLKSGDMRPSNDIRPLESVSSAFNEPWFINPDQTLVGSPRKLAGSFAGRQSWNAVQDLILRECNPLKTIKVIPEGGSEAVPILTITKKLRNSATSNDEEKTILITSWPKEREKGTVFLPTSLPMAPTVRQLLATLTKPNRSLGVVSMKDLAASSNFDLVKLTGGFAVVSDWGIFVLDDWTTDKLEHRELRRVFEAAALLHIRLRTHLEKEMNRLTERLSGLLAKSPTAPRRDQLLMPLSILSVEVAQLRGATTIPPSNFNARLLKEAMNHRWSLDLRLSALEAEIKAIDSSLRGLTEARMASTNRFIAVYGFALFLASGLASPLAKTVYHAAAYQHPTSDAPGLWVLLTFGVLALLFFGVLGFWVGWTDPLHRSSNAQCSDDRNEEGL